MALGGRQEGVISSVGVLDGCAINLIFPCIGGVLSAQGDTGICAGPQWGS